jgi:ATP-binding protein involved in chromosome partitioning
MAVTEKAVMDALSTVIEPELHKDLVSLDFIRNVSVQGNDVSFTIMLTTPACPMKQELETSSVQAIRDHVPEVGQVSVNFDSEVKSDERIMEKLSVPIKNIVAVASGKGGVGKTTVSANIAIALATDGARVGLLDADIYGPNVPIMLGIAELPPMEDEKIVPAMVHDIHVMSMGFLIPRSQALVWRGPMLHSAISQLFSEVRWPELDYLVVDLPPGTGDAQLSLAQLVPLTGAIIVTTPQDVALADARRGADAFTKLEVPLLGVIENMSGSIFGTGGGANVAAELGTEYLGTIPMEQRIAQGGDTGNPIVAVEPEGQVAQEFRRMARVLAGRLSVVTHGD